MADCAEICQNSYKERILPSGIYFRAWKPRIESSKAIIFLHRGHEHSGRLQQVIEELNFNDAWVFAWDARGHGKTKLPLGSFNAMINDTDEFVDHLHRHFNIPCENIALVAHSFSAVAAADYMQRKNNLNSMVLLTPAFHINLYVPFAYEALRVLCKLHPAAEVRSYVSGSMLTCSREEAAAYDADPSITKAISVNALLELRQTAIGVLQQAGKITVPTMLLLAAADRVVHQKEQLEFFERLSSPNKVMKVFPGMKHDLFHELEKDKVIYELGSFLRKQLDLELQTVKSNRMQESMRSSI